MEIQVSKDSFLDYTGTVQCNSGTTTVFRLTSDSSNQVISSGNQCDNGIKKMTTVDSSSKCSKNFVLFDLGWQGLHKCTYLFE